MAIHYVPGCMRKYQPRICKLERYTNPKQPNTGKRRTMKKITPNQQFIQFPSCCGKNQIGETRRGIEIMLKEHLTNIKNNCKISVAAHHISECKCIVQQDEIKIIAIETEDNKRKIKEALFINVEDDCISHTLLKIENTIQVVF